ncbi:aminoglycoside 3'-phosphotransferase [Cellulomonas soli]|uniref:aminoglycoside 3'-phosphotransferase n=1 Tax=Cellulomonas soli TaxID=931535 RepID=UPI003F82A31E
MSRSEQPATATRTNTDRGFAGPPATEVGVPAAVARFTVGAPLEPVWQNQAGGLTWRSLGPDGRAHLYLKWSPTGGPDLHEELQRLAWAAGRVPVPPVVAHGQDGDGQWLVTRALDARSAVDARWLREPRTAARAIGTGLRRLHEELPVADCPFSWSVEERTRRARAHLDAGDGPAAWQPEHRALSPADVLDLLGEAPAADLVVCHGDACAPNTLLDDDGEWAGIVDLGRLGVADRWADLAVATWSLAWNYGPDTADLETELLDAYGIEPDPTKIAYYRLLWDVS